MTTFREKTAAIIAKDREVKSNTGVIVENIDDAKAEVLFDKGAQLDSTIRAGAGKTHTFRVAGIHGGELPEFTPSKASGKMTRSMGLYLEKDGVTSLTWVREMEDKPLGVTIGSYITIKAVYLPAGTQVLRQNDTDYSVMTYGKGGWHQAGENNSFADKASDDELRIIAFSVATNNVADKKATKGVAIGVNP